MNILLLSNSAPNYHHFFKALVRLFVLDGAKASIAVDSKFSRTENRLDELENEEIHVFETFFRNHTTNRKILSQYEDFNLNAALLSDFERAQTYNIWGSSNTNIDYFDKLKSALLSFFEMIFEKHQTDIVLYENVSNSFAHFALFVAQRKGKRYAGLGGSRLPGRFSISSDPMHDNTVEKVFDAIQEKSLIPSTEVRSWVKEYIEGLDHIVPDYMKINGLDQIALFKRYFRKDRVSKVVALLHHAADSRTDAFQIGNPLFTHMALFQRNVARRFRSKQVRKLYQEPHVNERYLLYPLHFHPESSTSILAGAWLNEYEVIRNIAFNIPEGVRLYVKDHASAWAFPNLDFYRKLASLPNVRILPPEAPTKTLIKGAEAVITLTSTVGYEALLLKRRVFLYGEVFYGFHKGVTRIESPANIYNLITSKIGQPIDWDDSYNEDFVCAYHHATYSGTLNLLQEKNEATLSAKRIYAELNNQDSRKQRPFINEDSN